MPFRFVVAAVLLACRRACPGTKCRARCQTGQWAAAGVGGDCGAPVYKPGGAVYRDGAGGMEDGSRGGHVGDHAEPGAVQRGDVGGSGEAGRSGGCLPGFEQGAAEEGVPFRHRAWRKARRWWRGRRGDSLPCAARGLLGCRRDVRSAAAYRDGRLYAFSSTILVQYAVGREAGI